MNLVPSSYAANGGSPLPFAALGVLVIGGFLCWLTFPTNHFDSASQDAPPAQFQEESHPFWEVFIPTPTSTPYPQMWQSCPPDEVPFRSHFFTNESGDYVTDYTPVWVGYSNWQPLKVGSSLELTSPNSTETILVKIESAISFTYQPYRNGQRYGYGGGSSWGMPIPDGPARQNWVSVEFSPFPEEADRLMRFVACDEVDEYYSRDQRNWSLFYYEQP